MTESIARLQKTVLPTLRRYGVRRAGVFGSYARGQSRADSDIDILVEFEEGRSLFDLSGLRIELSDLLGQPTDVVTYASLHPRLRKSIIDEEVPIL